MNTRCACRLWICLGLAFLAAQASGAILIETNTNWRFRPGGSEASTPDIGAWRTLGFDDGGFTSSPAPFWYGDVLTGGTQLSGMQNNYGCIFLRKTFTVTNLAEISGLRLGALVDDGFAAWINGYLVQTVNLTNTAGTPILATDFAINNTEPVPFAWYNLPPLYLTNYLVQGQNVLAIQVFNTTLASSDLGFDCQLESVLTDTNPPVLAAVAPAPGTLTNLTSVTVTFSEPVTGVAAGALLVNSAPATNVTGSGATYTFFFPPPAYGAVSLAWATNYLIVDQGVPPNRFDGAAPAALWTYQLNDVIPPTATLFPAPGATVRALAQIEAAFSENVAGLDAADLLVNGVPATNLITLPLARYLFQFAAPPQGLVQLAWAGNHGITDLAVPPQPFGGGSWTIQLDANASVGDLVITEICANNQHGLEDEDLDPITRRGEAQDWIEIHNRGTNAVDLANWSLSDDPNHPAQWVFTPRLLPAGGYLVVFASGKDRPAPAGTNRCHTNFKLGDNGEFLGLYAPESPRRMISGFAPEYPEQRMDYSYGYDGAGSLKYYSSPSPGAANGDSPIIGLCPPVHFSTERGHYTQPFDLYLTTPVRGATILYTTNGVEPTLASGLVYAGKIRLAQTTLLRAAAFKANLAPSTITTHTYLFNQSAANLSLPILSLVTAQSNLTGRTGIIGMSGGTRDSSGLWTSAGPNDYHNPSQHGVAWERPISCEYIIPADNSGFHADCGIRVQGSDYQRPRTTDNSKFSFRLYFRGDYGVGRLNYPLFPLTAAANFDQIVLRAGFNDNANPFIRDELSRRLSHDMGQVASHGTLVNLFINGVHKGYYNPTERVHESFAQSYHGGSPDWDVVSPPWSVGSGANGVVDGDRSAFAGMISYINSQDPLNPNVYQEIGRRLDLVNYVDYLLLNVYASMGDWPHNNFRAGRDRAGGPFRFWVWDGEWGFGIYSRPVTANTFAQSGPGPDDSGLATSSSEIAQIYQRLKNSPEFRLLFADRIQKQFYNNGALTDANIIKRFNEMRTNMMGVLPGMDQGILTTWVPQRRSVIFGHFQQYELVSSAVSPTFSQHGGRVARGFGLTLAAGAGTIYYTTNGTDPRVMFSGAVAPDAKAYAGSIPITTDTQVRARLLTGTNWSALTEAQFQVLVLNPLRFTEIHYHPDAPVGGEFVEFKNFGSRPLDLSGCSFEGLDFQFPGGSLMAPGEVWLLASNGATNEFLAQYPGVNVKGWFGGQLNNGGERLRLHDLAGRVLMEAAYDDEGGWPLAADGAGVSLEIVDPLGDPNDPANWQASATPNGTPGVVVPPLPPLVRLNEVMADNATAVTNGATRPDWVELHNPAATPVDISNWRLTDDGNPFKFIFPPNTVLAAGGYLVVWCDAPTNAAPGLHTGFALDRDGSRVYLLDAGGNRVDAVSFGHQLTDYSLGRVNGEWRLTLPTPLAANTAASLAGATNLVLNEWLANPFAGQEDWIELYNRSASLPVALRDLGLLVGSEAQALTALAFVPPCGYVVLGSGSAFNHLTVKLPAGGGSIILVDGTGAEISRATYAAQTEGVSSGRWPNITGSVTAFPGSGSPGAPNFQRPAAGLMLNEVLARNQSAVTNAGRTADYFELFNNAATSVDLGGLSVSVNRPQPGQFVFPAGTVVAARGYLVVWCDPERPAAYAAQDLNTGRGLDGDSGAVYLFDSAGWLVDQVEFGPQVLNQPIGLSGGRWQLLAAASPAATNAAPQTLRASTLLRINEWMANPASGPDWLELHNPGDAPVELSGLYLSDDPSPAGLVASPLPPLSFVGASNFVRLVADANLGDGRHHLSFRLNGQGDTLWLARSNAGTVAVIDTVAFGYQAQGISQGRLPDGSTNLVAFAGSASPGAPNYVALPNLFINEIFFGATPAANAIEIHNAAATEAAIGGWYLSDSGDDLRKWRLPNPTTVATNGYQVFTEAGFGAAVPGGFRLDPVRGGDLWLSAADGGGALLGWRTKASYRPMAAGASAGRVALSGGQVDYLQLLNASLNAVNGPVAVGPVVINEVMYHPPVFPDGRSGGEYVELFNSGSAVIALADALRPGVAWRLAGAVEYVFPADASLAPGQVLLVVDFDPADAGALASFRAHYNVPDGVVVLGPFAGRLADEGERLELLRPEASIGDRVPYSLAEALDYGPSLPWPAAADGGGAALQRRDPLALAHDPANWIAGPPAPGTAGPPALALPVIIGHPQDQTARERASAVFTVTAGGSALEYQWRFQGGLLPGETNAALVLDNLTLEDEGDYDVVVSTPAAVAISSAARLDVASPPELVTLLTNSYVRVGSNLVLTVSVRGANPFTYQWLRNGEVFASQTGATLTRTNFQIADDGWYEVVIRNPDGVITQGVSVAASLPLGFAQLPLGITALPGELVTLSMMATGRPGPFTVEWRTTSVTLQTNIISYPPDFFTFTMGTNQQVLRLQLRNPAQPGGILSGLIVIKLGTDFDRDGLADAWEAANGLSTNNAADALLDSDGDGMSNLAEYRAGTIPTNALSQLWIDGAFQGGNSDFSFLVPATKTAALQFSGSLGHEEWQTAARFLALTTNRYQAWRLPMTLTNRYYRLVIPAPAAP